MSVLYYLDVRGRLVWLRGRELHKWSGWGTEGRIEQGRVSE